MFSLESLKKLSSRDHQSFMSLVIAIQDLKAFSANNTAHCYQYLPKDSKDCAIKALFIYLSHYKELYTPSDIHRLYVSDLNEQGWKYGVSFCKKKKQSPHLCSFKDLPIEIKHFLTSVYVLVKNMAPIYVEAFKEVTHECV